MKTPFGPKRNVIIVRISALQYNRAKILTIISLLYGPIGVFIKSFWFLLTFSSKTCSIKWPIIIACHQDFQTFRRL